MAGTFNKRANGDASQLPGITAEPAMLLTDPGTSRRVGKFLEEAATQTSKSRRIFR